MTLNRWKVLACTLTVGVGGLAVFATPPSGDKKDAPKEPVTLPALPAKPTTPANGADTPEPVKPAKSEEFELTLPVPEVPPAPPKIEEPTKKAVTTEPVFEPVVPPVPPAPLPLVLPAKAEEDLPKVAGTKEPPTITAPPAPPKSEADKGPPAIVPPIPPKTDAPSIPPLPDLKTPEVPKPATIPLPSIDLGPHVKPGATKPPEPSPFVPMSVPFPSDVKQPIPPNASIQNGLLNFTPAPMPPVATKATEAPRLKMLLRMGDGQPRFEIRNTTSTELLLKVYGEKVEMQAPPESRSSLVGVTAIGKVKFTAPGIEGTCDHLTILSATGEVLLKGNIHLKTKRGKSWSEMTAEKMVYQIATTGLSSGETKSGVRPASYIPD